MALVQGQKYVDLAALSLSGSLVPSVPCQLLLKFNPPKMTLVYFFEQQPDSKFFHEILLDPDMLSKESVQDIVSHLYVTEAYYFNPKQVRRPQLERLVSMMVENLNKEGEYVQGIAG